MIKQDNPQTPKMVRHSQAEMEKSFQVTDASREHWQKMRSYRKAVRANRDSFAAHQNALATQTVEIDDNTKHRAIKNAILRAEAANSEG